jgi:CHAD domain-containing protein
MMSKHETILFESLDERWKKHRAQLRTCRNEFSEEAVHDLRVATRRLLAVLDIVRALAPHPRVQKTRKALKGQLDALDELRDVQVMLVEATETIESLPQLKPLLKHLHEREKVLLRAARKQVKAFHSSDLKKRIEKIKLMLGEYSLDGDFNEQLFRVADQSYLNAMQAYGKIDSLQPATIHSLRVAFKKFRYMVEIIHPILPDYPETHLERMHNYQSTMGNIQDVEIFRSVLTDFVDSGASSFDPEPVRQFYEQRRAELISAFMEDKGELNILWRNTPDQPFPWEKRNDPLRNPSRNRRKSGGTRHRARQSTPADKKGTREV